MRDGAVEGSTIGKITGSSNRSDENDSCPLFAEFAKSAIKTGIENPINGVAELVGGGNHWLTLCETDDNATGLKKFAGQAGSAVGAICDFVLLSKAVHGGFEALDASATASGEGLSRGTLAMGSEAHLKAVNIAATTGMINGALLTPTRDGESQWSRLGQGITQAGTFATMSLVAPMCKVTLPTTMLNAASRDLLSSASRNALTGLTGGFVNANLEAFTHGRIADPLTDLRSALSWGIGNVAVGTAIDAVGARGANVKRATSDSDLDKLVFAPNPDGPSRVEMFASRPDLSSMPAKVADYPISMVRPGK